MYDMGDARYIERVEATACLRARLGLAWWPASRDMPGFSGYAGLRSAGRAVQSIIESLPAGPALLQLG
jgi:hypothetical protein